MLREHPRATETIRDFLGLIELEMLQVSKEKRAIARVVAGRLRQLLGKIHHSSTTSIASMEREDDVFSDDEQLRLTLYNPHHPPSAFDRLRVWLEYRIGLGPINWYPLPPVNRLQSASQSRLTWQVGTVASSMMGNLFLYAEVVSF